MSATNEIPNLSTRQLTSLNEEVYGSKPNLHNDYYIAIEVPSLPQGEKKYKFVQVQPQKQNGGLALASVRFHSKDLNAQGVDKIAARAKLQSQIKVQTLEEFKTEQAQVRGASNRFYKRHAVIMSQPYAAAMTTNENPANGYSLVSAVQSKNVVRVRELINGGVNLNGNLEINTALTAAIRIEPLPDSTAQEIREVEIKQDEIISLLLKCSGCSPLRGTPSALELAVEKGDEALLEKLLVHCVKGSASPSRVCEAVQFCLAHCPRQYASMSKAMLSSASIVNTRLHLTKIPPAIINKLIREHPAVACTLMADMQQGCIQDCNSYNLQQVKQGTPCSNPKSVEVSHLAQQGWQTCYHFSVLLDSANIEVPAQNPPQYSDDLLQYSPEQLMSPSEFAEHCHVGVGASVVSIDGVDSYGKTSLMHAVESDNVDLVSKLISEGAKIDTRLSDEQSKVHITLVQRLAHFLFGIEPKYKRVAIDFTKNTRNGKRIKQLLTSESGRVPNHRTPNRGFTDLSERHVRQTPIDQEEIPSYPPPPYTP